MGELQEGAVHTYERTFTVEEVEAFADISHDRQARHLDPGEEGRVVVHGLLTATLPTKIGGDLELLASRMDLRFLRPVYTGQRVRCRWKNESVTERENGLSLTVDVECTVEDRSVMTGTIEAVVVPDEGGREERSDEREV